MEATAQVRFTAVARFRLYRVTVNDLGQAFLGSKECFLEHEAQRKAQICCLPLAAGQRTHQGSDETVVSSQHLNVFAGPDQEALSTVDDARWRAGFRNMHMWRSKQAVTHGGPWSSFYCGCHSTLVTCDGFAKHRIRCADSDTGPGPDSRGARWEPFTGTHKKLYLLYQRLAGKDGKQPPP